MLFYYAVKTVSLASHIALEEVGADYESRLVDFATQQQRSADYLGINPKGRVPALATSQGVITETPALLVYIAQTHPDSVLALPADPFAFAKLQEFNNYLCATVHVNHAHRMRGSRWVDDEAAMAAMRAKVPQTMAESFRLIEEEMLRGPWVLGEDFSVCDCYLFTISNWLAGDKVDIDQFPEVAAHAARMREREPVRRVLGLHGIE